MKALPPDHAHPTPRGGTPEFPSASTNPCKLCTPLGACLAFKGIAGTVPLLHGSQGCATYIRRYLISHFREPVDIASSNFSEDSAVFGGRRNLHHALDNVGRQYHPDLVGVATTCLSETMGENMPMLLGEYHRESAADGLARPPTVHVSTPSYKGTHAEGFNDTVRALVESLALPPRAGLNAPTPPALLPGMVSPADLRHLRDFAAAWQSPVTLVPDYSETLDGGTWSDYERMPTGGTTVTDLRALGRAAVAIECGLVLAGAKATAGTHLARRCEVPLHRLGLPIGLRQTDALSDVFADLTGRPTPLRLAHERARLVDAYVDAHKYLSGRKAIVYGEEDLVASLAIFLAEIGIVPVLCAAGGRSGRLEKAILTNAPELANRIEVREGSDFADIEERITALKPDLLIGSSKGYKLARALDVPLVRCGFPVHDRLGAQRIQLLGYAGTQQLFDRIVNALLEAKQAHSEIGYSYL
ncbi:nitrogenase component 1 [Actomonas aquatica]|uniref:Nitrogenase component 1 n=1 Tax=Actomonas aquatica TaxID=2866162 RepID=A0ABZ1C6Y4_9BACT|nr:nitrogenase component 1 [Opitutus sp. WL0086]WRQ87349.1 nitrogenase component 1 [Opitutus sp. WL0086]